MPDEVVLDGNITFTNSPLCQTTTVYYSNYFKKKSKYFTLGDCQQYITTVYYSNYKKKTKYFTVGDCQN